MGGWTSIARRKTGTALAGLAALCLGACATLEPGADLALSPLEETAFQTRVLTLAAPVLTANAGLCRQTYPFTGLVTMTVGDWPGRQHESARRALQADHRARVWIVADASPAAEAGLQAGDSLLSLNGRWSEPNARWHDDFRVRTFPAALRRGPARLRVEREGEGLDLVIAPQPACAGTVRVTDLPRHRQHQPAWIADGTLYLGRAFAQQASDNELRAAIALATARQAARDDAVPAIVRRGRQGTDLVSFAFGLDAIDQLAGRGPGRRPPRRPALEGGEITLAGFMLAQAGVYGSRSGPASPASPAASGPEGASDGGSISSIQP